MQENPVAQAEARATGAWACATVVGVRIRSAKPEDFEELHRLDLDCFVPGISYSARMLKYFLSLPDAICLVAEQSLAISGFILAEVNPPLGHIITLDVDESHRRTGTGTALLRELETRLAADGIESVLLESAVDNASGIAFWEHHGYRTEAVIKRYYLGRIDAYEMRKQLGALSSSTS
jgi:ribosomal protein S18 acetylase RimI-like enzyme